MKIAVGVGSRGIENLGDIVRCTIAELKQLGAEVPAVGSHGGGTSEGQQQVLAELGITAEKMNAPIRASMETVYLGTVMGDVEVYFDKIAFEEADGIVQLGGIQSFEATDGWARGNRSIQVRNGDGFNFTRIKEIKDYAESYN